jgi:flagellar motor switch protein FliN/FliY
MTTSRIPDKTQHRFSDAFFNTLVAAMTEACGSPWQIAATPEELPTTDGSDPVRIALALDGSLRGDLFLEFQRAEATELVSKLLGQTTEVFGTEQTEALLKLVEAAASELSHVHEQEFGTFTISASSSSKSPSEDARVVQITAANDDASHVSVVMYINPELIEALLPHSQPASTDTEVRRTVLAAAGIATPDPINLDLVMDVELNVTLRFGKRQLTLREVMELTTGSVVELDREVEEPVELLLNGMVIARGEAVVIDGNYGLRVTEVSQHVSTLALN